MDNYEEKCLELDKQLARVFGFVYFYITDSGQLRGDKIDDEYGPVPRWTQDDGEAFRLAVKHKLDVDIQNGYTFISTDEIYGVCATHENFYDEYAATRFAICQAILAKLEV